ncbi:TetR/AcrR family transcriptional regulator [Phreatobacter stygius]|uniref:TetR/AcrR family transcriptional regulator n=1 Tax=Phreatobacter stygius TaxID=1940610 RepID=A0A4D7B4U7_9HYPH|nr:TetR/AcrR family transcriptional regulator [Phreatobacter stygius]QCI63232.1 TetR/AcrR family transcriptional regulator [Phreatobacter stygius]
MSEPGKMTTASGKARGGRSTSSRANLLRVGAEMLARDPRASLDDIARAAKVGRATLHRHFASRTDLLREIGLAALTMIEAAVVAAQPSDGTPEQALRRLIDALTPLGVHAHFLLYAADLFDDPALKQADERITGLILPVVLRARRAGLIRADVPDAWIFASLEALLYAAWNAVQIGTVARNDAPRLVLTSFLQGVGGRGGSDHG